MKIVTIIGARPQFIKAATVSRVIRARNDIQEIIVHTGQHYDDYMSAIFFSELDIPEPEYNLGIGGSLHGAMTGQQLEAIEGVLLKEKPDWVLVYGDTNSTLAGALAAVKLHIPVAHVEAGLRSFNRKMPEEINRILTDHASDLLFAPTEAASANLAREGILKPKVQIVGDVMYDAALFYARRAEAKQGIMEKLGITKKNYILTTIHRAENTDNPDRLKNIVMALTKIAENLPVIFPVHPRTRKALVQYNLLQGLQRPGILAIKPVGYLEMVFLEKHSALIVTDSGGVQKEAYFHGVPCVTLRDETEWVELVDAGWNTVVSPVDLSSVAKAVLNSLGTRGEDSELYGDGKAAARIVNQIASMVQ